VENKIERLEYAIGDNPLGPFKVTGVIMDESPTGCWTNHHSIIQFKNQWYLFYHHNDYSPKFDKARSIRVDSLFFNSDGTIKKVIPTLRGIGTTKATKEIQLDRYTAKSNEGASISFLDTLDRFKGWKTIFNSPNAWIQYNSVDFGKEKLKSVRIRVLSETGGTIQVREKSIDGPVLAEIVIPKSSEWTVINSPVSDLKGGVHNLFVISKNNNPVEVDWINFR
jgi:hypothetical protein